MRRRVPLTGWLVSEAVSLTGTRVSMVALPWLVLTTTGSATRTGLVAFAEMAPYVVAKAATGPWVDRVGARRVCVLSDLVSVAVVGAVPLLHLLGTLSFPLLLGVVALAGAVRGPGDGAKHAMVPAVVAASGVPLERATGLGGAVERLASTVGAGFAGLLVATVGPATALVADAASFAVSAGVLLLTAPPPTPREPGRPAEPEDGRSRRGGYRRELAEGWEFLRRDPVLVSIVAMVSVTNLLDAAYTSVLVPVWADRSGGGATAVGLLFGTWSAAAVAGSLVASAYGARLPRFTTYVVAFLVGGVPRFAALALGLPLPAVLAVAAVGGLGGGFVNPILGAVVYERVPTALMGRVTSLNTSLAWAGIPLGGLLGGVLVAGAGLAPGLWVAGAAYLVATMVPVARPAWREIDRTPQCRAAETSGART